MDDDSDGGGGKPRARPRAREEWLPIQKAQRTSYDQKIAVTRAQRISLNPST